jgi:hypothetical protein
MWAIKLPGTGAMNARKKIDDQGINVGIHCSAATHHCSGYRKVGVQVFIFEPCIAYPYAWYWFLCALPS